MNIRDIVSDGSKSGHLGRYYIMLANYCCMRRIAESDHVQSHL